MGCAAVVGRVFDRSLALNFDKRMNHELMLKSKCFRARNNNDIVSRLPLPPGYHHVGTEIYFDRL